MSDADEGNKEWPKPETVPQCHEVIDRLGQQLARLQAQVAALEERLRLNSKNSSKPPSSDGPGSGNRAQRRSSERKRGAQEGHKGSFRALLDEAQVDEVVDCQAPEVCECGAAVLPEGRVLRHQVFEVPPLKARVEEYRLHGGRCSGCGRHHRAALPPGVPRGQLGPRALALIGTLATRFQMSQHKIRELLADVMGLRCSIGAVSQAHGLVGASLKAPVDEAVRSLAAAPIKHMDETSYGREGQRSHWVWTVVQPRLAVFSVLPSRALRHPQPHRPAAQRHRELRPLCRLRAPPARAAAAVLGAPAARLPPHRRAPRCAREHRALAARSWPRAVPLAASGPRPRGVRTSAAPAAPDVAARRGAG